MECAGNQDGKWRIFVQLLMDVGWLILASQDQNSLGVMGEKMINLRWNISTEHWQMMNGSFPIRKVEILATCSSDHSPVTINFQKSSPPRRRKGTLFRYETAWHKCKEKKR